MVTVLSSEFFYGTVPFRVIPSVPYFSNRIITVYLLLAKKVKMLLRPAGLSLELKPTLRDSEGERVTG